MCRAMEEMRNETARETERAKAVMRAIKMDNFKDFEDCLQDRCAEEVSALDMAIPYWADLLKGSGITLRSLGFSTTK